ncbi:3'-5' RNA nuclease TATDN2 isoform X2 [Mixophyes fleayi]
MADRRGSSSRKHKWLSPAEMSPNKYLKSNESKLPRRVSQSRDYDSESPSPPRERHVTLYPYESTPKHKSDLHAADRSSGRTRSRGRDRPRVRSLDSHESSRGVSSADVVPGKSAALGEDYPLQRNDDSKKCKDTPKLRRRESRPPCALFQRAVSDILGTSSRARRSLNSETTSPQDVEDRKETSPPRPEEAERSFPKFKPHSSEKDSPGQRSSEERDDHLGRSPPSRPTFTELPPEQGPDVQSTQRLVFLYEDDKDSDTADVLEKDPSIGSDFSDLEDVGPLARFSQDDVVEPCCSVEDHRGPSPSSYVMYPRHLYGSPWRHYTDLWPGSPMYRPSAEQDTWRQAACDSSFMSERSVNILDNSNLNASGDGECAVEKTLEQPGSLDSPLISDRTTKPLRRTLQVIPSTDPPKFSGDGFIDTHCHLDMLFSRLSHKSSFAELRRQYTTTFPREFQGCITDYCDPRTLRTLPWQQVLNEDMVWGAFGCHPHFAQYYTDQLLEEMLKALRHPKAIAFGEMGLDYSHKCSTKIPDQHMVFEKQLKVAVALGKPLVIHCRDADDDLFEIMKRWVPRDYKIHRHCFTGSYEEIEPSLNEFPNMAVGFTAVLTYTSAGKARDAVTRIPLERLIVETDAPFFVPRQVPRSICKFAHPGLALHTVQEIARLRNLPVKTVLSKLRENTHRIYSI